MSETGSDSVASPLPDALTFADRRIMVSRVPQLSVQHTQRTAPDTVFSRPDAMLWWGDSREVSWA